MTANTSSQIDSPWLGDACSLVDAYRSGERTPAEELEAVLAAIDRSQLNAFCHLGSATARAVAGRADTTRPFGGVPIGVKELDDVEGWPATWGSLVFADQVASHSSTMVRRLDQAGAVKVGQTTASEFAGLNVSVTKAHGVTRNPWRHDRTVGGSSGGSAAAVAGGLVPLATGSDAGGSIRLPAGYCGLVGMKGTRGRIPRGPRVTEFFPTLVLGCLARSVRDVARWYDVCSGYDSRDPHSLPRIEGWERNLGRHDLRGKRAVIAPDLGSAVVRPEVEAAVRAAGQNLAEGAGLKLVDVPVKLPKLGNEWTLPVVAQIRRMLGDRWPDCKDDLTRGMAAAIEWAEGAYNLEVAARDLAGRPERYERMADVFDQVDFILCATNADVAFPAEVTFNTRVGDRKVEVGNDLALTAPANLCGNPAITIPTEPLDGLPVGLQVIGRPHEDALLLDLALVHEREHPWPLVAPGAPT